MSPDVSRSGTDSAVVAAPTGTDGATPWMPPLAAPRPARQPTLKESTLDNGLRVLAVRRPGVPLVEVRLRVPFAGRALSHCPRAALLAETLLSGTANRSTVDIAVDLQEVGGGLSAGVDPDRLLVSGNALASGLPRLLEVLADVLTAAAYPNDEVAGERARLAERLRMARSQPGVIAREALLRRMYGGHPYARDLPEVDELLAVTAGQLRSSHRSRVLPRGSVLVLVGDISPARAVGAVDRALSEWAAPGSPVRVPAVPPLQRGPMVLVDRPGAVQSNIRLAGRALPRDDPDYPAMQLANMVFGGYFSSRLTENIREDKGYTYSPHCMIDHSAAGSAVLLEADVATEVTAPALVEIGYELGRMATLPVSAEELDNARQYAIGTLALQTASQAGLATMLTALAATGLGIDWLRAHPRRLAKVTVQDVHEQSARFLAPSRLVTVVVGDGARVRPQLSTLDDVVDG